jgi:uncharacterized protein (TIGR02266 family)
MIKELVKLANDLDNNGLVKEADFLDAVIKKASAMDDGRVEPYRQGWNKPPEDNRVITISYKDYDEEGYEAMSEGPKKELDAHPLVRVEYANVEDFLRDYTSNESIGGMFIRTERPIAVGTQFKLLLQVPARTIETLAKVRWTLPVDTPPPMSPGIGIHFGGLSKADKEFVENMLAGDTWLEGKVASDENYSLTNRSFMDLKNDRRIN